MNNAPSVACPVVRSRFQAAALVLTWLAGALTTVVWLLLAPPDDLRPMLAVTAVLVAGLMAVIDGIRGARGTLRWNGAQWVWQAQGACAKAPALVGTLGAVHDLQRHLLVQFRAESGAREWLWCSRTNSPEIWLAWRRAVFFRTPSDAPASVHPPADPVAAS